MECNQREVCIDTNKQVRFRPNVKTQSACADPGITTVPRSVVQVPMTDVEPTDLGEVCVSVSMLPVASVV